MIRAEIVVLPCEIKGFSARICLMSNATKDCKKATFSRKAKRSMSKAKNSDPETFPLFRFRKLREPEQQQSRTESESLPLKELDYSTLVSIQKIVDGMMTRELRRNYPEAEIVQQILKNPAVVDAGKAEVVEAVRERVRFNSQTRWLGR
jgi:hypothetical protein